MLNFLKKADKGIEIAQFVFSGTLMFAIMWLTFFMVFFRYVLNDSIIWAEEILRYLMMWTVLVGAGLTTREDQHVSMDIVQTVLRKHPKARAAHYIVTRAIVFVFMIWLIGPTLDLMAKAGSSTATSVVWLHKSVIYAAFIGGIISVNLSLLGQVPRKIAEILSGTDQELQLATESQAIAEPETQAKEGDNV